MKKSNPTELDSAYVKGSEAYCQRLAAKPPYDEEKDAEKYEEWLTGYFDAESFENAGYDEN